jgi:hypothetical protein
MLMSEAPTSQQESLVVRRYMDPAMQRELARVVRTRASLERRARVLGQTHPLDKLRARQAFVFLSAQAMYEEMLEKPEGLLGERNASTVKRHLESSLHRGTTESASLPVSTLGTGVKNRPGCKIISYSLEPQDLLLERDRLADRLGELNGTSRPEGDLVPCYVTLSVIAKDDKRRDRLVDAFETERPPVIDFLSPIVLLASEARAYKAPLAA